MTVKKSELPDNPRKRKRIVPTREAGTPAFDVVDDLFSQGFAYRNKEADPTLPHPTVAEDTLPYPTVVQKDASAEKIQTPVSPNKNFTKFSNSILKQAVPEGLFRGQSKHTYDVLYLRTRGAINPVRQIQLTKTELVKLTGLEIKTIQRHLSFLRTTGLITVDPKVGDHKGAIYEVNIPEEITLPYPTLESPTLGESSLVETGINYTPDPSINSTTVGHGLKPENIGQNEDLKTSLKTNTKIDDEPFGAMLDVLTKVCEKVSGRVPRNSDKEKWKEFAELIAMELEIAATRTSSISSVPAFLTEHLRRRLIRKISAQKLKASKPSTSKNKESEFLVYEAESLSQQGREVVLKTFREYIEKGQRDFVLSFEETYTKEDWLFLMENSK